jgi:hypothetical protein
VSYDRHPAGFHNHSFDSTRIVALLFATFEHDLPNSLGATFPPPLHLGGVHQTLMGAQYLFFICKVHGHLTVRRPGSRRSRKCHRRERHRMVHGTAVASRTDSATVILTHQRIWRAFTFAFAHADRNRSGCGNCKNK